MQHKYLSYDTNYGHETQLILIDSGSVIKAYVKTPKICQITPKYFSFFVDQNAKIILIIFLRRQIIWVEFVFGKQNLTKTFAVVTFYRRSCPSTLLQIISGINNADKKGDITWIGAKLRPMCK
ncbi:uncharacterized protein EV154DRAFT_549084 [Mucor mucedo]|uniref:uncharacterized protein n=1 Tax=Mucor mucedo TaxID=29922 RepID=UPI00221ED47B|nr:uncharacterized protein EV154DRAFT_549084 [Mucor mucedo]KAI7894382.1 hypothetical protein EV154DRAFT_549084 [Mucor mucedo]